ncbi:unnamed protein product [Linum tenue]|uniref:Neprosin PEP catalytic domain-containing protein n=1 Tax=Linum tenue TaxID=586396 RepID=A0AAV0NKD4_9ROSI|nr:unnamed protein product [Linum tenue]
MDRYGSSDTDVVYCLGPLWSLVPQVVSNGETKLEKAAETFEQTRCYYDPGNQENSHLVFLEFHRHILQLSFLISFFPFDSKQTKYGDTYDCVDFYEQPAFDHPLLKDRKYEFQASTQKVDTDASGIDPFDIWVNGKGCPSNTVPIRKMERKELIRTNMAAKLAHNISTGSCIQFAILRTQESKRYYGGGMITSVYHPQVGKTQYSASRVKFQNGPDSIAVGWTVNPSLYPDGGTRLFIYTTTKNSQCYNTYCPGFIILRTDIPLDLLLKPYSTPGKTTYEKKLFVRKDPANGNWFLQIGIINATVGTWPQKIFTGLSSFANYIDWGGEVYSPAGVAPPQMGAGYVPVAQRLDYDCYGIQVTVINDQERVDYDPPSLKRFNSSPKNYSLIDEGNRGDVLQRIIIFGGNSSPSNNE